MPLSAEGRQETTAHSAVVFSGTLRQRSRRRPVFVAMGEVPLPGMPIDGVYVDAEGNHVGSVRNGSVTLSDDFWLLCKRPHGRK